MLVNTSTPENEVVALEEQILHPFIQLKKGEEPLRKSPEQKLTFSLLLALNQAATGHRREKQGKRNKTVTVHRIGETLPMSSSRNSFRS